MTKNEGKIYTLGFNAKKAKEIMERQPKEIQYLLLNNENKQELKKVTIPYKQNDEIQYNTELIAMEYLLASTIKKADFTKQNILIVPAKIKNITNSFWFGFFKHLELLSDYSMIEITDHLTIKCDRKKTQKEAEKIRKKINEDEKFIASLI